MIGGLLAECKNDQTTVALVSDHGAIPTFKRCWLHKPLMEAGLLAYRQNAQTGALEVDLAKSSVVPNRTYIFVNMAGRDPGGIVDPMNYDRIRQRVIECLYAVRDPETGECPFELVTRKETTAYLFGQPGPKVGDIIYFMRPGYTDADINYHKMKEEDLDSDAIGPTEVRASHHQYLPCAEYPPFTNGSFALFQGPGIRKGYCRKYPIWSCDITPTLAFLMGIPLPADVEGKSVTDILEVNLKPVL
jgi:predicted AlkP superfamily phosphohydrolase/phosphomutase